MYKSLALFALAAYAEAAEWGRIGGNFHSLFGKRSVSAPYESYGFGHGFGHSGIGSIAYDSDGPRRSAHDKDRDTYGHENGPHDLTEFGEKDTLRGDDYDYGFSIGGRGYGGYGKGRRHQELDLDDDRRGYGHGFGLRGGYGIGSISYDSDGPRRSAHDKDGDTKGHENGPHGRTELGEKDTLRGDDYDYGFTIGGRGYGYGKDRRHQELDLDDDRRGYGHGIGLRRYGIGSISYDSDGPRRSAHDKDGDTKGHENGPHGRTEFGEKDTLRGDDADYGFTIGGRGYGYGRDRRHQELDLDDDRRSYGGYGYGGYGGYGRLGRRGSIAYDSDGPRRSAHDKDRDTYGHENGPHGRTELGDKDTLRGDDYDYGFNLGARRGYGYGGRRHQELDLDDNRRGYGGYGGYGRRSYW